MGLVQNIKSKDNGEPFPAKQLLILGLCRLAEPVAFISIISYNFAMVKEIKGPENASFYAGLLVSAFAIAEATTAIIWGSLSDRFGRKPIILIGLTGTALSSLMLGFAKTYWVALVARLIGGLLNGNVAVMQTMVAEMVKNPKHEPRAYSIQPFAWSLGSIAGSALGGYASQPARFYPRFFSPDGLFGRYPYLLPNLIAAICIAMAILQASLFLKETNPRFETYVPIAQQSEDTIDERTPLRGHDTKRRPSFVTSSMPTPTEPLFDVRRSSFASIRDFKPISVITQVESAEEEGNEDIQSDPSLNFDEVDKVFTKPVILWIAAIALMCYHQMAFVSVFPIYILDTPQRPHGLDLKGGLGLTVHDVGQYMAVNSCWSLIVQGLILPAFMGRFGVWKSIVSLTVFCPIVDALLPFITALPKPAIAVYFAFALQGFCTIIIYPSLLIMLKDATPSRGALGRVNGVAVSASSAARTIAPPLIGVFYSVLGSAGAWWSCAAFATFAVVQLCFIQRPKQEEEEVTNGAA